MDELDSVSIFVSEGAAVHEIVAELERKGEKVDRDAFGHVRLDQVKVGDWFGKQFATRSARTRRWFRSPAISAARRRRTRRTSI
jgi:hypothetical protein